MSAIFWVLIALGPVIIGTALWAAKRVDSTGGVWLSSATPGTWFLSYHTAWTNAHPGAFERGDAKSGGFYLGRGSRAGEDVWGSSTLEWDREWFRANGMGMPRHTTHVDPPGPCKPNEFRIGTLGPGESVSIPITFDGEGL